VGITHVSWLGVSGGCNKQIAQSSYYRHGNPVRSKLIVRNCTYISSLALTQSQMSHWFSFLSSLLMCSLLSRTVGSALSACCARITFWLWHSFLL
jgi:hypothetical protein